MTTSLRKGWLVAEFGGFFHLVQASDDLLASLGGLLCGLHTAPCEGHHAKHLEPSKHWETRSPAMMQPWTLEVASTFCAGFPHFHRFQNVSRCFKFRSVMLRFLSLNEISATNYGQEKA